jgi:predicted permease
MFWRRRQRLDEEIASHLAEETADNLARGLDPVSARRAALRAFGNVEAAKERHRERDPLYRLDTLWQDTRFACRLIARHRWVSLTIVTTLTIGIALNVTVFSVLNALLLRPWVRSDPDTFVSVIPQFAGRYPLRFSDYASMSQPDYVRYRDAATSLESLAAYRLLEVTLSGAESGSIRGGLVSCNVFDVIRPGPPVRGRYLLPDECTTPMEAAVAVLSESLWRTRFNADPRVIGQVIHLNRIPFTVVGVAPSFTLPGPNGGPTSDADVWAPYTMLGSVHPDDDYFADSHAQWLTIVGRRRRAYTLQQVHQELSLLARQADDHVPGRRTSLIVTDGALVHDPEMRARAPLIFSVTLGTTSLLLLLVCVNVATLLLSRSAARQQEIAVRLSMGAGRARLLRQFLTESLVLSGLAAFFSFLIAQQAPAALWNSLMSRSAPFALTPDRRVLLYCVGVAVTAGVIAGVSPALESLRPGLSESLKGSHTALTPGRRRSRVRSGLVAVQIAVSLVLVVQVGLLTRAQRRFFSYDPGFDTHQVLRVTLASVIAGFDPPTSFYDELEARVKVVPGVVYTSYASIALWAGRTSSELAEIDGQPIPATRDARRDPVRRVVSPEYFAALGIPLTRGRLWTRDGAASNAELVPTIISEAMARRYWPTQDPVRHHFRVSGLHEVIGVCRDVQSVRPMQDDGPVYYVPLDVREAKPSSMLVRVAGDTRGAAAAVREMVRQADPQMASTVVTLASIVEQQGEGLKPVMRYGAVAGMLALLLSLTGVYGVVSFSVSQRVREIGIRLALGAQPKDVVFLVLRSGVTPVCGGLMAGVGLALAASTGLKAILFGVNPRDPVMLTVVTVVLFVAAIGAIWVPARRAATLDPLSSLRYE